MEISWLGAAGLLIKSSDGQGDILIDPYVSGTMNSYLRKDERRGIRNRIIDNQDFNNVKMLIATHNHFDHTDDIPFIWSRWYAGQNKRKDLSVITVKDSVTEWKTSFIRRRINNWSQKNHKEFLNSIFPVETVDNSLIPKISDPGNFDGTTKIEGNKIILGSLRITFIRHFHSNIPILTIDEEATKSGAYGLYIEDSSYTGDTHKTDEYISCKNTYCTFSAGLPYTEEFNKGLKKYEEYEIPQEFHDLQFKPDWLISAVNSLNNKRSKEMYRQYLRCFNGLKEQTEPCSVNGLTPIHWDRHMFVGPRRVGQQKRRHRKKVISTANYNRVIAKENIRVETIQNILFGIAPSKYSKTNSFKYSK